MVASGSAPSQRPLEPGTAPRLIVPSGQRGAGGARRPGPPPRPCALAVAVHNMVSAQTRKRLTFIVVLLLGTLDQQPAPKASARQVMPPRRTTLLEYGLADEVLLAVYLRHHESISVRHSSTNARKSRAENGSSHYIRVISSHRTRRAGRTAGAASRQIPGFLRPRSARRDSCRGASTGARTLTAL